ncbi:unnamed protein product [Adineta ricciae]|nr:unnamed protein product [Adineta ricciae]
MYTNNNLAQLPDSLSSLSSSSLLPSTHLPATYGNVQNQHLTVLQTPSLSHQGIPSLHQYQYSASYHSRPELLSADELDLILSFRRMQTLNGVSPSQRPSSSSYPCVNDTYSYQPKLSFSQTGHHMQQIAYYAPDLTMDPSLHHLHLTTSQQCSVDKGNHLFIPESKSTFEEVTKSSSSCILKQRSSSPMTQQQSSGLKVSSMHKCNLLSAKLIIELLDPTKPYQIGDPIKIGRRILQTDPSSIKYWVEGSMTIIETTTGGKILSMGGYSYVVKNYGKLFTKWECERRRNGQCSTILIRTSDPRNKDMLKIFSIEGEHIHDPTPHTVELRKFKQRVRNRCRQELSSPRMVYETELMKGQYSKEMLSILPTFYNIQAQLYRIRLNHLPTSPTNSNFTLHSGFTMTDQGHRFLLYDSNSVLMPYISAPARVGRILIFSSDLQLNILAKSKRVANDGTFQTASYTSQQNYIIVAEYQEGHTGNTEAGTVPVVFCLCESKCYETYRLIMQILKTAMNTLKLLWKPASWMSDYENGLVKAIKEELPNTKLIGCAFHYAQSIHRNIQAKGLQDAYRHVEIVRQVLRQVLRQVMALAYVPSDQIRSLYYEFIKKQLNSVPTDVRRNLRTFLNYFESFWLKRIHQFCVFGESIRTNNSLEGYNNKMNAQLSAHPHLYKLILWLEKEELLVQQLV